MKRDVYKRPIHRNKPEDGGKNTQKRHISIRDLRIAKETSIRDQTTSKQTFLHETKRPKQNIHESETYIYQKETCIGDQYKSKETVIPEKRRINETYMQKRPIKSKRDVCKRPV